MRRIVLFLILPTLFYCKKIEFVQSAIPEGAIWEEETIRRDEPISGYKAIAVWAQAATMRKSQPQTETALIVIDYWKVIEIIDGDSTIIYTEDYDYQEIKYFNTNEAGLYCRYPHWFDIGCNDEHQTPLNMSATQSFLTIDVAQTPDAIIHWWTPKLNFKPGAIYSVKARVQIDGSTAIQFGMDYWRTINSGFNVYDPTCQTSNNCEAWITDWVVDNQGDFVEVTLPQRKDR